MYLPTATSMLAITTAAPVQQRRTSCHQPRLKRKKRSFRARVMRMRVEMGSDSLLSHLLFDRRLG